MARRDFPQSDAIVAYVKPLLLGAARQGRRWLDERLSRFSERSSSGTRLNDPAPIPFESGDTIRHITEYVRHTVIGRAAGRAASLVVAPQAAPKPTADDAPAAWHLEYCVERRLEQLRQCHDFRAHQDSVEAVHDFRVATRSLRAYLDVFEPFVDATTFSAARRALRRGTRALGGLRELDVHVLELEERLTHTTDAATRVALEHTLWRLRRQRGKLQRHAARKLARIELVALRADLRRALQAVQQHAAESAGGLRLVAWLALEPTLNAVAHATAECDHDDAERLHALRIRHKQLRYTLELFRPLLGDAYETLHRHSKSAQEVLGEHHDRAVLLELLDQERRRLGRSEQVTLAEALGAGAQLIATEKQQLFEKFQTLRREQTSAAALDRARAALLPAWSVPGAG